MGLIGSIFGSSSSNKASTSNVYNTTTNTSSNTTSTVRDVGLTGQAAVSLADISSNLGALTIKSNENMFNNLIDGVKGFLNTAALNLKDNNTFAKDSLNIAQSTAKNILTAAESGGQKILESAQSDQNQMLPIIVVGFAAIALAVVIWR